MNPGQSASDVLVIRTGAANLASVVAGLRRAGASPRISDDTNDVLSATRLVLPGVGAFGAAMRRLREADLIEPLRAVISAGRPLLAICLGLQLLAEGSDESPGVDGLGLIPGRVRRLTGEIRIPQLGWNRIEADASARFVQPGYAYYANSYALPHAPAGFAVATSRHGARFVAAIERGGLLACQFHPELSGAWGAALLRRWLSTTAIKRAADREVRAC